MAVHENQAELANDYTKMGLAGKAGGRVENFEDDQVEYALGDISPDQEEDAPGESPEEPPEE